MNIVSAEVISSRLLSPFPFFSADRPCFCFVAKAAWYVRFIFRAHPAFQKNPIPHGYLRLFFTRGVLNGKCNGAKSANLYFCSLLLFPLLSVRGVWVESMSLHVISGRGVSPWNINGKLEKALCKMEKGSWG